MPDLDDEELRATRKLYKVDVVTGENVGNIQIGEYVRINKDRRYIGIGKLVRISSADKTIYVEMSVNSLPISYDKEQITKHSKNIIDLIEVGDYVNGEKVLCFKNENCDYDIGTEYSDDFGEYYGYNEEEIKTIVTKEQFNAIEYKVEE